VTRSDRLPRLLFIGPLPPPVTGQAVMSQRAIQALRGRGFDVVVINTRKASFQAGLSSLGRVKEVASIIFRTWLNAPSCEWIYLSASQSAAGNLKDLVTIMGCPKRKVVLHLHGGGLDQHVLSRSRLLRLLNRFFLRDVHAVAVLSESLKGMYRGIVDESKLRVLENYVEPPPVDEEVLLGKHAESPEMRVLFLSNMIREKGYQALLDGFLSFAAGRKERVKLAFAGAFSTLQEEEEFRKTIEPIESVEYLGVISGEKKEAALRDANILCLPTWFPWEGQPLAILEAYAHGCVVITTRAGGIPDIFDERGNGFYVSPRSPDDIRHALERYCGCHPRRESLSGDTIWSRRGSASA